jgi:serine/threonine-protein kinase
MRRAVALVLALLVFPVCRKAAADGSGVATAQALFDEARRDMEAGRYTKACPKFASSYALDPGLGTQLNLAVCYEKNGQTATAWATFKDAAAAAAKAGETAREQMARAHAAALEPKLASLSITVPHEARVQGLEVHRDGAVVPQPAWGMRVPVDPGEHVVDATAPGGARWSVEVNIHDGESTDVRVQAPAAPTTGTSTPTAPPPAERSTGASSSRVVGFVAAGVGLVAIGIGSYFGVQAFSQNSTANDHCPNDRCDQTGVNAGKDAQTSATISTIGFGVGAAALAAGAYFLFFASPSRSAAGVRAAPLFAATGGGVQLLGSW